MTYYHRSLPIKWQDFNARWPSKMEGSDWWIWTIAGHATKFSSATSTAFKFTVGCSQDIQRNLPVGKRWLKLLVFLVNISAISSVLLEALMDPSTKTAPCLQVLLQTSFVHFIDAPSLALIMPVLQRALSERSTETKKMAAQIIGNMCSLTDKKVKWDQQT